MNIPGAPNGDPLADDRPIVAGATRGWVLPAALVAALILGAIVFLSLNSNRQRIEAARMTDPAPGTAPIAETLDVPPPPIFPPVDALPPPIEPAPEPVFADTSPVTESPPSLEGRLKSPVLVVDLSEPEAPGPAGSGAPGAGGLGVGDVTAMASGKRAGDPASLSKDEIFAQRLGGENDSAKAGRIENPDTVIPQGAVIAAVLETAINSDLPGFTRAVVSRDVRGFSGKLVLIPRGSRLIGQYRSGVALGQSRAFVIWTRLIRPDGVTIDLGSPGADAVGRGGLEGRVDRHYLRRFGSAIVLSLISAAASQADDNTQVIINSSRGGGISDAAAVALEKEIDQPPTIKVNQGAPIRVFIARDLNFTGVETEG
jgi:type IV secretion system protein VirB10